MSQPTITPIAARPRRRRWFSYSLRTLIVFVTLAAIGMAWVAKERSHPQRELQIADDLQSQRVAIEFAGEFDPPSRRFYGGDKPSWLRSARGTSSAQEFDAWLEP